MSLSDPTTVASSPDSEMEASELAAMSKVAEWKKAKVLFLNIFSNYGRWILSVVSTLALTPLIMNKLGPEAYGLWALTMAVAGYFNLTDVGIGLASNRYIAHYLALKDWKGLNELLGVTQLVYIAIAALSILGGIVAAYVSPGMFKTHDVAALRLLMLNVGVVAAIGFLTVLPTQCVISAQRLDKLNFGYSCIQLVTFAITVYGLINGWGILILAVTQLFSTIGNGVLAVALCKQFVPQARFFPSWNMDKGKLLFSFVGCAFVASLASRVIYYTDTLIIGMWMSVAAVASYAIAMKLIELMRSMVWTGVGVLGVFAVAHAALDEKEALAAMWMESSKWSIVIALPICAVFTLLPAQVLSTWLGQPYADAAAVLSLLSVAHLIDLSQASSFEILFKTGAHRSVTIVLFVEAILNFSMSLLLVRQYGLVGVAAATVIPLIARSLLFYPICMTRMTRTSLRDYLLNSIGIGVLATIPTIVLIVLYKLCVLRSDMVSLAMLAVSCSLASILSAFLICFSKEQRYQIQSEISAALTKVTRKCFATH